MSTPVVSSWQRRTWELLELAKPGDRLSQVVDVFLLSLIFLNVAAVIIGTVASIEAAWGPWLALFEHFSVGVFTLEYLGRMWSCAAHPAYAGHPWRGRWRFAWHPLTMIDLIAILPSLLPLFSLDLRFVRILRLLRILRLAKLGRYFTSLQLIGTVIKERRQELIVIFVLLINLLIIAASLMYYCEKDAQPERFGDIPQTMWWAIVTLTTVGYGDAYPVTPLGKVFGAVIAILGIGMFALPTGILGSGFVDALQQQRKAECKTCPHCGKSVG